jgi:hypothetical protein
MLAYSPYALVSNDIEESDLLLSSSSSSNKSSISNYYSSSNITTKYLFLDTESEHNSKAEDIKAKSSLLSTLPLEGTNLSQATDPPSCFKHIIGAYIIALAMRAFKRLIYKIIAKTKISYS